MMQTQQNNQNELSHHGILGQRWGVRRYQNSDGTLTPAGRKKYGTLTNYRKVEAAKKRAKGPSEEELKKEKARSRANLNTQKELEKYNKIAAKKKSTSSLDSMKNEHVYETNAEKKARILKSGDVKSIYENRHLFSTQELNDMNNRITAERNIERLLPKTVSKGEQFVKTYIESGKTIASFMETSNKMYTEGQKFYKNINEIKKMFDEKK